MFYLHIMIEITMGLVHLGNHLLIDTDNYYNACPFLPKDGQDRLIFTSKSELDFVIYDSIVHITQIIGFFDVFELWTKEYIIHPCLLSQRKVDFFFFWRKRKVDFDSPVYGKKFLIETWNMLERSSTLLRAHDSLQGQIWL